MDFFKNNVNVRKYSQKPVEEEHMKALASAIRGCFSMDNRQPWKVVIVRDEQIKKMISSACNSRSFIEAPVALVLCALPDEAYPTLGGFTNSYTVDAGMLMERISLAARHLGMQTEWIYAFKEEKIREIVRAPQDARVVSITPLGVPDEISALPPAKQMQDLIAYDHF